MTKTGEPDRHVLARKRVAPRFALRRVGPTAPARDRAALEGFIGDRFAERYGARIRHFMPELLGLEDGAGQLRASVGLRDAGSESLFLERYLDHPVECEIRAACGYTPPRERIVEVGNLAARSGGAARVLIVALTDLLAAEGFDWVVFTATPEVVNSFHRLELEPMALGDAQAARMGAELAHWGSYYDAHPQVMAGHIVRGRERLSSADLLRQVVIRARHVSFGVSHVAAA
ncbi:thermostable hemolysin [Rhodocyclaceae bacterium SMB388]